MRVAFIHPFLYRYARGIERYTFNLANALSRQGVEMSLLTWRWQVPVQIEKLDSSVQVHIMPTSRYYAAAAVVPFYVRELVSNRYDLVWIYFAGYGEAEALTLVRGQRFGIVFHYPSTQVPHRYREFTRYGLARRASRIVSVSRFVADGVREALGRESVVIHHGVDTNRFAPDPLARIRIRKSLNLAPDTNLLATTAALEERKGVQWVLQALPRILCDFPNTTYLIVGDGPYRMTLEAKARELGVDACVRFLGAKEDVTPFYQAADVSLILSHGEASSFTALESMACETPIIAARQKPFDEIVTDNVGMLVDEADSVAVAGAVVALLSDPGKRRLLGQRGRTHALNHFSWTAAAQQYLEQVYSGEANS